MNAYVPIPMEAEAVNISSTDHDCTGFKLGYARRLYVGGAGNVVVRYFGASSNVTYTGVPAGSYLDGAFITIVRASTTATNMVVES